MWIPKAATLIRGRRLFEAQRLLAEMRYEKKNDLVAENVGKGDFVNFCNL